MWSLKRQIYPNISIYEFQTKLKDPRHGFACRCIHRYTPISYEWSKDSYKASTREIKYTNYYFSWACMNVWARRIQEKGWWFQKMSRISSMERLQRGQVPLFNHSSLEHTLQNVCPHGMNAAPFFLPMHTQHTQSFPTASTAASPPSVSSNSRINDTLKGVPSPSRNWRSAASAAARFIPELDWLGPTCSGPVWFGSWPAFVSCGCCCACAPPPSSLTIGRKTHVAPQQPIPVNLRRSLRVRLLRWALSTPSICSVSKPRMVLVSLSVRSDSCNIRPSWLISTQLKGSKITPERDPVMCFNDANGKRMGWTLRCWKYRNSKLSVFGKRKKETEQSWSGQNRRKRDIECGARKQNKHNAKPNAFA